MAVIFDAFDFKLLDDPEFREDSVREELVVPLLRALGYSASPPHRIIRSRKLEHPYVYFGTVPKYITIIPDYLLERDGERAWILDAKAPNENIDSGKNVEQAYSYAMHRDVRVRFYALCNGRKLVVYDVTTGPPILDVRLDKIDENWREVLALLGSKAAWPNGLRPDFQPDLGLALVKAGLAFDNEGKKMFHMFLDLVFVSIARFSDEHYTITALQIEAGYMMSLDFDKARYAEFLGRLETNDAEKVRDGLSRQPYIVRFKPMESPVIGIAAKVGDTIHTNENESYLPFLAEAFI